MIKTLTVIIIYLASATAGDVSFLMLVLLHVRFFSFTNYKIYKIT